MSKLQKTVTGVPNFGVNRSIGPNLVLNLHSGKITNSLLKHESPIKDSLDDYEAIAVFIYAATDVMHTGNPIMKIRRDASPLLERDFTETELYDGTTYNNFLSGGANGFITKVYNQAIDTAATNPLSTTHLVQATTSLQPTVNISNKSLDFDGDMLASEGDVKDYCSYAEDFTIGVHMDDGTYGSADAECPLFTIYNGNSGGSAFPFGSDHMAQHRELQFLSTGSYTPPAMSFIHQDNAGTNDSTEKEVVEAVNTADVVDFPFTSIISKSKGDGSERTITVGNQTTETNDTALTASLASNIHTNVGIGGHKVGGTQRAKSATYSIKCVLAFKEILSDSNTASLKSILDNL